jgi:hypothetical protein
MLPGMRKSPIPVAAAAANRRAVAAVAMGLLHLALLFGLQRSLQPGHERPLAEPPPVQWLWRAEPPPAAPTAAPAPAVAAARTAAAPPTRPAPRRPVDALQAPAAAALPTKPPKEAEAPPPGAAAAAESAAAPDAAAAPAVAGAASASAAGPPPLDLRLPRSAWSAPPPPNPALQNPGAGRRSALTLEQRLDLALGGSGPWTEEVIDADHRRLRRGNTCVTLQRSRLAQIDPFSSAARNLPWQVGQPTRCAGP